MQFKKFRTERERNARRKLSLDKLMNERDKKQKRPCHAEEGSLEESKVFKDCLPYMFNYI